ncbi:MAG: SIS domain-containing protein [Ruminococcaceae bacterium]|nr:SIS domain-containing protein [Oscillospiraceae bacterium]
MSTTMKKEIFEEPAAMERCLKSNEATLNKLAETLQAANISNVVVAARGTSDHAGIYGKYIIESMLGIPVGLAACSTTTLYGAKLNFNNMLVIGISQSGAAADVLELIKNAKETGAITLTITNNLESPLAAAADFHLYCDAGLEESVAATKTFGTQMYLIAQFVARWAGKTDIIKKLEAVPKNLTQILLQDATIAQIATRYRFMEEAFILSRGINYPLALEATLKIQETNYVRAKAYPISDFHHGPFAMVSEGMPVFMYMSDGPVKEDSKAMIEKLQSVGADLFMVTDDDELLAQGDLGFKIPSADKEDMIASFYFAVFAQLFAANLAEVKGRNPDAPRGLKKVTITK